VQLHGFTLSRKSSKDALSARLVGIRSAPRTVGADVAATVASTQPFSRNLEKDHFLALLDTKPSRHRATSTPEPGSKIPFQRSGEMAEGGKVSVTHSLNGRAWKVNLGDRRGRENKLSCLKDCGRGPWLEFSRESPPARRRMGWCAFPGPPWWAVHVREALACRRAE
jgi:hypothetical protein